MKFWVHPSMSPKGVEHASPSRSFATTSLCIAADDDTNTVNAILTYADTGLQTRHKVDGSSTTADATLRALELSDVTLVPTFVSTTEPTPQRW